MQATTSTSRAGALAAKHCAAASSVAPVASGYERSLRPRIARFSRRQSVIRAGGDL
jgi:hypothetical protein